MKDMSSLACCKGFNVSYIQYRKCYICPDLAVISYICSSITVSDVIMIDKSKLSTSEVSHRKYIGLSAHSVKFIFCILSEKTPRNLFEVCAETEGCRERT